MLTVMDRPPVRKIRPAGRSVQRPVFSNNEIWKLHQRAYKKYFARTRKGTMSKPEFEKWARDAEQLRDRALKSYEISRTLEEKNRILDKLKADLNCV